MKTHEFKNHFSAVHERVKRMSTKINQHVVGSPKKIDNYRLTGYMHKTRLHKTKFKLSDFDFLRYMMPAGDNYHYFEGEMCINRGRLNQQVVRKVLVCEEK